MDNNGMFSGMGNTDAGNNTYGYNYGEHDSSMNNTNNTFGQSTFDQNTFGQSTMNQNTFGQPTMNQNTFGQNASNTFGNSASNTYNTTTSSAPNFYATDYNFNSSSNGYQEGLEEPMKVSEYLLILALVSLVPCVGLIMLIVWSLSTTEKQSKVNFCRAYLIIMAIGLALGLIGGLAVVAMGF